MIGALREGFRAAVRRFGLVLLLYAVNVLTAALLAVPLAGALERNLRGTDAARNMMYGFDYNWWSRWSEAPRGYARSFGPELFGVGFAFRNLELLLQGNLPAGLFLGASRQEAPGVDPVILALGALYLVLQVFLTGGVLGARRAPSGTWTVRGLLHGSGFYFGRMLRVTLLVLVALGIVFRLNAPFTGWVEERAREAVSETTALAWLVGRHVLLLLVLLVVSLVSSYAKVIIVAEERGSAVLALLSSLSFCAAHFFRAFGHYLAVLAAGIALLVLLAALDGAWVTTGYKTQAVALLLMQGFVLARIALRVALCGGQMALYRAEEPGL